MISKYLYVESWLIQYEFSTRRLAQRRPTRSSAVDLRERWYLSWLTPWLVGLPMQRFLSAMLSDIIECFGSYTISSTLRYRPLAASPTHTDAVDDIALLGFVA